MKNASFTPTECCLSCLAAHAVFWHDASSFGRWETRNTSTSLCQTPSSQGEALWWHSWQWQTDNGWMLHFTFLTFLWKCLPPPPSLLSWRETKQKGWAWKEKNIYPSKDFFMKMHILKWCYRLVYSMLLKDTSYMILLAKNPTALETWCLRTSLNSYDSWLAAQLDRFSWWLVSLFGPSWRILSAGMKIF